VVADGLADGVLVLALAFVLDPEDEAPEVLEVPEDGVTIAGCVPEAESTVAPREVR